MSGAAEVASLLINEVMASNSTSIKDPQGQYDDWIELHNAGDEPLNAGGMYLTDDPQVPTKWQIPTDRSPMTLIPARGFLLIWADGDTAAAGLHASFRLDAAGDRVALFDMDGRTLIDSVEFGGQSSDISYGRDPTAGNQWRFFGVPTPGAPNVGAYLGAVADTKFSHDRGFYTGPFTVVISTATRGASIVYTVDGSSPFDVARGLPTGRPYTGPIPITTTTCLRAAAFKLGWIPTNIDTHTYIFLDDVVTQATDPRTKAQATPSGYPVSWGSVTGDYQMDPDVVGQDGKDIFGGLYATGIHDDLRAVPSISLVMDRDDWFGSRGIYINESQDGTERVASFEFIDPCTGESFQDNCALAMQGGVSGGGTSLNRWKTFKLSMRPRFKARTDDGKPTGGPSKLEYRLFPDSPVKRHNTVVLDAVLNHSWLHPDAGQRNTAMYIQDQYVADLHNAMGGHSPHGSYAHVYINGLYWGLYWIHERPDHAWAAEVFGGSEEEYDALKHSSGGVINIGLGGNATASYNAMVSAANAVGSDPGDLAKYRALCERLDVDDFITYLLANWFTGNHDWPHKNWYATHRNTPDGRWRFHSWDAEHTLEGTNDVGKSPSDIHARLAGNAEYRLRFADIIHRVFFHGGPLTYPATAGRYEARMAQVDRAIVGESARWGDNRQSRPYTQQDWLNTQNAKLTGFFPSRTNQVLGWLKNANLYPSVAAPAFHVNGTYQHGGHAATGARLSMQGAGGEVWYTLDGSDPRVPAVTSPPADEVKLVAENGLKRVLVPTAAISDAWRTDPAFNDSAWTLGVGGVGYERSSGYQSYIGINVQTQMYDRATSCYIRIPFTISAADLGKFSALLLRIRYDDGFIAYLNGTEVQRALFTGTPAWNSRASASHSDSESVNLEAFDLRTHLGRLRAGANLLAIHGLNNSTTSTDFLISAELAAYKGSMANPVAGGVSATAVRYGSSIPLQRSACVKARALSGGTWSALNEAVFTVGPVAEGLRISEIMFHPAASDPNTEYIELTNIGIQTINLNLVRFTDGIEYSFPSFELPAGGYCLLVQDIAAFEAKYGTKLPVVGRYAGSLSNGGERIELVDAAGAVIHAFEYDDNWFDLADGLGFSLTVKAPETADADSLGSKQSWRPSAVAGGSPGANDSMP